MIEMEKIFDIHAHYDDVRFDGEEEGFERHALLARLFSDEVGYILGAGTNIESSKRQIKLAERYDGFYAAVGFHPECYGDDEALEKGMDSLRELLSHEKAVAVGEIGLDYYWEDYPSRETQKKWFRAQLALARECGYPVVVHDREAHGDVFDILSDEKKVIGALHSFSGSAQMASDLVKNGWYVSFSGVLTFKNARKTVEAMEAVPLDRILLETDAPYLAPVPFRGRTNHSGLVRYTAERAAEIKGISADEMIRISVENAKRLFRIK